MGARFIKAFVRWRFTLITCVLVTMTVSLPAQSADIDVLANKLLSWVVDHSILEAAPAPGVRFHSSPSIASKARNLQSGGVIAAYDIDKGIVLLSEGWDPQSTTDQSILLHELVHHLQVVNGVSTPCVAQLNFLAYALQLEWLREIGIEDAEMLIGVNDAMIFQSSACADPFGALPWH